MQCMQRCSTCSMGFGDGLFGDTGRDSTLAGDVNLCIPKVYSSYKKWTETRWNAFKWHDKGRDKV